MNGITIPYIPAALWLLAAALTITILLIMFGFYAYWQRRTESICQDGSDVASLAARKERLEADVESLRDWILEKQEEIKNLEPQRAELSKLENELHDLHQRCIESEQKCREMAVQKGDLENRCHQLNTTINELEEKKRNLDQEKILIQQKIQQDRKECEDSHEELLRLKDEILSCVSQREDLDIKIKKFERYQSELNLEISDLERKKAKAESDFINAEEGLDAIIGELERKRIELNSILNEYTHLKIKSDQYRAEANKIEARLPLLEDKENELKKLLNNLERIIEKKKNELKSIEESIIQKKAELENLKNQTTTGTHPVPDQDEQYNDLLTVEPSCLIQSRYPRQHANAQELALLGSFKTKLQQSNIQFPDRVIDAFHTSLKCQNINPLTVLAGVSGTGKTLLPVLYARHFGLHYLVMPVQPRWDSPQDLFGFYNYLEKVYKATDLSRALIRLDPYNDHFRDLPRHNAKWARDRVFMVLLDEMNLARTEYYFSEFLSKLELRRNVSDPRQPDKRKEAEIELDVGPGGAGRFRLWVPDNILFVGTMNEDETTQTLSDKVLDRANVLRFGKPDRLVSTGINNIFPDGDCYLAREHWQQWRQPPVNGEVWDKIDKWIGELNQTMEKIGRPFAHRVYSAMIQYVANYPQTGAGNNHLLAFADQIEQKIIPKLRGLDMSSNRTGPCLSNIKTILANLPDNNLSAAFSTAEQESKDIGLFTWRGVTR